MYCKKSLKCYLDDLAAKLPAPGGGSAAALTASCGVSLISMVINFTLGKPQYAKYEMELKETLDKTERLRQELLDLVDKDVLAYKSRNIRDALNIPFMTARLCFEGIKLCPGLINKSNKYLISDLAVAAVFLEAGFKSAYFNVEINLKSLKDADLTFSVRKELSQKEKRVRKIRFKTEEKIGEIIRG